MAWHGMMRSRAGAHIPEPGAAAGRVPVAGQPRHRGP